MNQNTSRPLDAVAALIMLALTLSWGLNQVSVKLALPEIPPFIQATVRSIGAFAIIVLWARWRGVPLAERDGTLAGGIAAGVLFGVEFLLIFRRCNSPPQAARRCSSTRRHSSSRSAPAFCSARACALFNGSAFSARSPDSSWRSACRMRRATARNCSATS